MPVMPSTTATKTAQGEYDHAVDGGAISTITLRSAGGSSVGNELPAGSVILGGYLEVDTAATSGGTPAVSIGSEGAADLVASGTLAATGLSTTGRKSLVPAFSGATSVKTTAARSVTLTIATATLTAGKFRVVLLYR
jgi:hypothetical protein